MISQHESVHTQRLPGQSNHEPREIDLVARGCERGLDLGQLGVEGLHVLREPIDVCVYVCFGPA